MATGELKRLIEAFEAEYNDPPQIEYNYDEYFESKEKLWEVAECFHAQLKGMPDYIFSRILLNVDEEKSMIHLTQWANSNTKVRVQNSGPDRVLIFPRGKFSWGQ